MNRLFKSAEKNIKDRIFDTSLFRLVYVVTLSFEMIAFADIIALPIRCIVLTWGIGVFIYNFVCSPRAFRIKYKWLMWLFVFIGLVTSIVNMSYDFAANLVFIYHTIVCFFIFYGMYTERSHLRLEKEMVWIFTYLISFATFFGLVALIIVMFSAQINISGYYLGIFRNRLIGVYTNSNLLAFSMVVSIVSCDILNTKYLRIKFKNKIIPSGVLFFCVGINVLCLFLSDSNASFVFMVVYFTVRIFYKNFSSYNIFNTVNLIKGSVLLVFCCIVMMSASFILRSKCQDFLAILISDVHKSEEIVPDNIPEITSSQPAVENYMHDIKIGRENYDVSSGRITLMKQGFKLLRVNPVIGIGRGNLVAYGEKYIDGGLIFSDLHNSYMTILVSYGVLGLTLFLMLGILAASEMCTYLFKEKYRKDAGVYSKLFSIIVAYCAYSMFEKGMLSEITFMVVFFWLVLGYATSYMDNGDRHSRLCLKKYYNKENKKTDG